MQTEVEGAVAAPVDEVRLLARVAEGDLDATRDLVERAGPVLLGFLMPRLGGDRELAEDLLQETLLEALRSWRTFRGDAALTTWLCAIARHRVARHAETERRGQWLSRGLRLVRVEQGGDPVAAIEKRDLVTRALGELPSGQREAVVLRYLDGLPVAEVAARMHKSPVQVQSMLQRARSTLRDAMGGEDD